MSTGLTAVSLFAGIGGFDLALERCGTDVVAAVEIDADCRGILAHRFPDTQLFNDVRKVTADDLRSAGFVPWRGILTGGFPCQDLSIAGRRAGLGGARSGLFWDIVRLADELRPQWLILENVPGLLSAVCSCPGDNTCTANGRAVRCGEWRSERVPGPADELTGDDCFVCGHGWDYHDAGGFCARCSDTCAGLPEVKLRPVFVLNVPHGVKGGACASGCMPAHGGAMGTVLGALGKLGYGFAYRVLDSQFFGVAQRRERVFIVGCLGDRGAPVEVLLEPEGGGGNSAQGREARAGASGTAPGSAGRVGSLAPALTAGWGTNHGSPGHGGKDEAALAVTAATLQGGGKRGHRVDAEGAAGGHLVVGAPLPSRDVSACDTSREGKGADSDATSGFIVAPVALRGRGDGSNIEIGQDGEPAFTLRTPGGGSSYPMIAHSLTSEGADASEDGTGRGTPLVPMFATLTAGSHGSGVSEPGRRQEDDVNLVSEAAPVAWRGRGLEMGEPGKANAIRSAGDGHVGDQMGYIMQPAQPMAFNPQTGGSEGRIGYGEKPTALQASQITAVAFATSSLDCPRDDGLAPPVKANRNGQDTGSGASVMVSTAAAVRRLTPLECERLQAFPDDWTRWKLANGELVEQSDSARYRQVGNAVTVSVPEWIIGRIVAAEAARPAEEGAA